MEYEDLEILKKECEAEKKKIEVMQLINEAALEKVNAELKLYKGREKRAYAG